MSIFNFFKKKTTATATETPNQTKPKDYVDSSDSKLKGFDMALNALRSRNYEEAEEVLKANDCKPAINHSNYLAYDKFFDHEITWLKSLQLAEEEVKTYLLLYYLYNNLSKATIAEDLKERTGIVIKQEQLHQAMRIINSLDEIIQGQELSSTISKGSSGLKMCYVIKSVKDGAVCDSCKQMEGQKFMFEDAVIGKTYPPFDYCQGDFCRCMALSKMQ